MRFLLLLLLFPISVKASDTITGNWRGAIIGHTDNRDYFIHAKIDSVKRSTYTIELTVFSGDYKGEYLLNTTLKDVNRLYINSFQILTEFPYSIPHITDCFTGYFLVKKDNNKPCELDLYRNAIMQSTADFKDKDSAGNYIPPFECFTTVLLHPTKTDTTFAQLEHQTDSIISSKRNRTQEMSKRKIVSTKEWEVRHEKITLQVWDNNKEDGDIISLKFNDTWLLNNFLLKKEKYTIQLNLKQKNNQLLLFAENLGSIPPNTAAISIDDNEYIRTFILNSDMSKSEMVKIILVK